MDIARFDHWLYFVISPQAFPIPVTKTMEPVFKMSQSVSCCVAAVCAWLPHVVMSSHGLSPPEGLGDFAARRPGGVSGGGGGPGGLLLRGAAPGPGAAVSLS